MKQFLKKYILHNIGFKIVAIVLAVGLWVLFTNMDDPIRTFSFEIPMEVLHQQEFEEGGRYIEIEKTNDFSKLSVTVFIRARNSVIDALRSRTATSFLSAYIDLYELDNNDPDRLIIHYNITDPTVNAELYSIRNKTYVEVQVEQNMTVEIPIRYEISGSPEEGYLYLKDDPSIVVTPENIRLTGPANQIEKVSYGLVSVSIESENANVTKVGNIVLKDQEGNNITYSRDVLLSSVSEASVFVPIYTYKTLTVESSLTGEAPAGYAYAEDLHSTLTAVQVFGPESVLNKMHTLVLPEIHLNLIRGEYSQTFELQQVLDDTYGENVVRLMDGQAKSVTVTLSTEQLEETSFTLSTDQIKVTNMPTDMDLSYLEKTVTINATGSKDMVEALTEEDIKLSLTFGTGDATLGKHTVKLNVTPIKGVTFEEVTITYTLKAKN